MIYFTDKTTGDVYAYEINTQQTYIDAKRLDANFIESAAQPNPFGKKWNGSAWVNDLVAIKDIQKGVVVQAYNDAFINGYTCTNGITMDATLEKVQTLKAGHDFAILTGVTAMDIRDFNNVTHAGVLVNDVLVMLQELGQNYLTMWSRKNIAVDAIAACTTATAVKKVKL